MTTQTLTTTVVPRRPSTDTADLALRMCRAERRAEALAAAIRLLCEDGTPAQRQAAGLVRAMLDEALL
ncbi:hypothetical protein ACFFX1_52430 [Dactylosporangium sucinum]|uniref:Uncharacterized protein n=1 Tax=Dactylosporangium sucinum TaxID=1424081 RepID=A0A917X6J1_9ACTN|nr:hypothetical protein [Dactylosporangium sucinum]GGM77235.1 hypothetical protein GCM10007977_093410 [Dactylosporangium sucinum]GGM77957.1 hypothetical protein GCM10007977_094280 [Dactylosporangium sucinum]